MHKREGSPKFGFLEIDCCNLYIREVCFVFDFGTLDFKVFEFFIFMCLDVSMFFDFWNFGFLEQHLTICMQILFVPH